MERKEILQAVHTRFSKKIMTPFNRALREYQMVQPGDRIAVCISGGKDSALLGLLLDDLAQRGGFEVRFLAMDPGYPAENRRQIEENMARLGLPLHVFETDVLRIAGTHAAEHPCFLCAKLRRGNLYAQAQALGCNKIALGHHYDDAIETFFMSLIFEGRLSCFQPVTFLDRTGITQIRPLLYCGENLIRHTAQRLNLPVVENPCPADGNTKRQEIKELVYELQGRYPGLKGRAFGAMQRLPLPEWGPVEHRRRPLPEEIGEE